MVAILTLVCFLSSTTEAHELFKLQHFIQHYFEHSSKEQNASLVDFLHVHYSHDHNNHQDEHHDKGCLPFQGDHGCQSNISIFSYGHPITLSLKPAVISIEQQVIFSDFIPTGHLSKIWQPPKKA